MTWPIVELTFWNPGDPGSPAVDALLADPTTPLAKHGLTGIAEAYARETGAPLHDVHKQWAAYINAKSLAVDGALTEVVPALEAEGIPFFVAKGPVIAYSDAYPDHRMRPYTDLDVYVPGRWLQQAREALFAIGYAPVIHALGVLGGLDQEVHGGRFGAVVEVHGHPVDNVHRHHLPSIEQFLPYVEHAELCSVRVPVLSDPAHVALQAIHMAAAHRYAKLILLRDTAGALVTDVPRQLGARAYLLTAGALTSAVLDPEQSRRLVPGVLRRLVVASLVRQGPNEWDEYGVSAPNVLALLAQPSLAAAVRAATGASRALVPTPNRRVGPRHGVAVPS